jgi:transcriptional regulator with XRE-family HTH domain
MKPKPLDQRVRDALVARKGDWLRIAEQSGVSHSWLSKFVNGHIDNPGFATLTRLDEYLTDTAKAA